MPTKRYKAEQVVTILRQIEVGIANGKLTPQACQEAEITVQTFLIEKWRVVYDTLRPHLALNYSPPAPPTFAPPFASLPDDVVM